MGKLKAPKRKAGQSIWETNPEMVPSYRPKLGDSVEALDGKVVIQGRIISMTEVVVVLQLPCGGTQSIYKSRIIGPIAAISFVSLTDGILNSGDEKRFREAFEHLRAVMAYAKEMTPDRQEGDALNAVARSFNRAAEIFKERRNVN